MWVGLGAGSQPGWAVKRPWRRAQPADPRADPRALAGQSRSALRSQRPQPEPPAGVSSTLNFLLRKMWSLPSEKAWFESWFPSARDIWHEIVTRQLLVERKCLAQGQSFSPKSNDLQKLTCFSPPPLLNLLSPTTHSEDSASVVCSPTGLPHPAPSIPTSPKNCQRYLFVFMFLFLNMLFLPLFQAFAQAGSFAWPAFLFHLFFKLPISWYSPNLPTPYTHSVGTSLLSASASLVCASLKPSGSRGVWLCSPT